MQKNGAEEWRIAFQIGASDPLLIGTLLPLLLILVTLVVLWYFLRRKQRATAGVSARAVPCTAGHKYVYGVDGPPCPYDGDPTWGPDP